LNTDETSGAAVEWFPNFSAKSRKQISGNTLHFNYEGINQCP
jgi:hypothetical protein